MISQTMHEQTAAAREPAIAPPPVPTEPPSRAGLWVWLIVLCLVGVAAYFLVTRLLHPATDANAAAKAGDRATPVVAVPARMGDMNIYLTGLGTVTPLNTVTIRSRVDGQILKVNYVEGQFVKQGELLIQIDPRPFQAQVAQQQGQLEKDQAVLENSKRDLQRYQSIKASITQQQIDTQAALVNQYQGVVDSDKGLLDNAKVQLAYCQITAPLTGRIGLRLVDVGNIVHANDQSGLAVITQLQPITVVFSIPEDQISQVFSRPDHGQGLEVDAYNRDMSQRLETGSVLAIDNQVDPTTGMVRIKAQFQNPRSALFPNEFVNTRLLVNTLHGVVIVPSAAVQRGPDSTFIYVVTGKEKEKKVDLKTVVTGPTEGDDTVIEKGINAGEVVVTDGVDKLTKGSKVTISAPDAAKGGATTRPARRGGATTRASGADAIPPAGAGAATRPGGRIGASG
jgi:membrane fusion protein, multidrug efflux system